MRLGSLRTISETPETPESSKSQKRKSGGMMMGVKKGFKGLIGGLKSKDSNPK